MPLYTVRLNILCGKKWYLKRDDDNYMKILKNLHKTETSVRRTLLLVPKDVRLKRFYCNLIGASETIGLFECLSNLHAADLNAYRI